MTPLEEICPGLPSWFAAKLADLRRGGARSIVDVPRTGLAPLYGEMLAHAPRRNHGHTFARATFLREWLIRRDATFLFDGWASTTCSQFTDSI